MLKASLLQFNNFAWQKKGEKQKDWYVSIFGQKREISFLKLEIYKWEKIIRVLKVVFRRKKIISFQSKVFLFDKYAYY